MLDHVVLLWFFFVLFCFGTTSMWHELHISTWSPHAYKYILSKLEVQQDGKKTKSLHTGSKHISKLCTSSCSKIPKRCRNSLLVMTMRGWQLPEILEPLSHTNFQPLAFYKKKKKWDYSRSGGVEPRPWNEAVSVFTEQVTVAIGSDGVLIQWEAEKKGRGSFSSLNSSSEIFAFHIGWAKKRGGWEKAVTSDYRNNLVPNNLMFSCFSL